jgi:predicted RND superfamily exporter protein
MIAVAFRSFTVGLLSIVPNLLPLALTGTILYWLGLPLEIASVCSFTVCLGIAVDDTIHFLTRYRFECQQGHDVCEAVRRAVQGVGGALLITTVILVSGFATVLVSELPAQRTFSAMACTTITSALLGDLVFLPAMLIYFRRFRAVHLGTPCEED